MRNGQYLPHNGENIHSVKKNEESKYFSFAVSMNFAQRKLNQI